MRAHETMTTLAVAWTLGFGCAPKAETIDSPIVGELERGQESGQGSFDHDALEALLTEHVDPQTHRVDYAGLKQDEAALDAYLTQIASAEVESLSGPAQKALLINAYNAYTLALILEHYPGLESIRDLDSPWKTARYEVAGHTLSLNDIEHGLLRPIYRDERIHFAVNCASIGCPPLRREVYTGEDIDAQLERATRATLQDPKYARLEGDELAVTRIFKWYGDDFTSQAYQGHASSIPAYVVRYATEEVGDFITSRGADEVSVTFLPYDWSLNDTAR